MKTHHVSIGTASGVVSNATLTPIYQGQAVKVEEADQQIFIGRLFNKAGEQRCCKCGVWSKLEEIKIDTRSGQLSQIEWDSLVTVFNEKSVHAHELKDVVGHCGHVLMVIVWFSSSAEVISEETRACLAQIQLQGTIPAPPEDA